MKVLEKQEPKLWTIKFKCIGAQTHKDPPGCGSLLEVEATDLLRICVYDDSGKWKGECAVFTCPCCKCGTDIPQSKLPVYVFENLKYGSQRGTQAYHGDGRN